MLGRPRSRCWWTELPGEGDISTRKELCKPPSPCFTSFTGRSPRGLTNSHCEHLALAGVFQHSILLTSNIMQISPLMSLNPSHVQKSHAAVLRMKCILRRSCSSSRNPNWLLENKYLSVSQNLSSSLAHFIRVLLALTRLD